MIDLFAAYDPTDRTWNIYKETDRGEYKVAVLYPDGEMEDAHGRHSTLVEWCWIDPKTELPGQSCKRRTSRTSASWP